MFLLQFCRLERCDIYSGASTVTNCIQLCHIWEFLCPYYLLSCKHFCKVKIWDLIFPLRNSLWSILYGFDWVFWAIILLQSIQFSFSPLKDALTFSFSNVKFMVESLMTCWPDSEPEFFFFFFFFWFWGKKNILWDSPLESYSFICLPEYDWTLHS